MSDEWNQQSTERMWIPSRPSNTTGDQYHKKKKRSHNNAHYNNQRRNYTNTAYNNQYQSYNNRSYNSHTTHNTNTHKPMAIIAKKKAENQSKPDISDSFMTYEQKRAKREMKQQKYLLAQEANNQKTKLQNYAAKQERYSQIKSELNLSHKSTQKRTKNNNKSFRVLRGTDNGKTKLAILDFCGDMSDSQLIRELDRQCKASLPLKPVRPPIPTQVTPPVPSHSPSHRRNKSESNTPMGSISSVTNGIKVNSEIVNASLNNRDRSRSNSTKNLVTLPTVQPMDSETLEQNQRRKSIKGSASEELSNDVRNMSANGGSEKSEKYNKSENSKGYSKGYTQGYGSSINKGYSSNRRGRNSAGYYGNESAYYNGNDGTATEDYYNGQNEETEQSYYGQGNDGYYQRGNSNRIRNNSNRQSRGNRRSNRGNRSSFDNGYDNGNGYYNSRGGGRY